LPWGQNLALLDKLHDADTRLWYARQCAKHGWWWTFAGGRINQTLKYALEWKGRWKVIPDNFSIKIQGDGVSMDAVLDIIQALRAPEFWQSAETRQKLSSMVPEYRLSKFQQVLPDRWQTEMVGGYLLDFDGTGKWMRLEAT
jgi:ATP-dependent Lhr-like helicase